MNDLFQIMITEVSKPLKINSSIIDIETFWKIIQTYNCLKLKLNNQ